MNDNIIETPRLRLIPKSLEETRCQIDSMTPEERKDLSRDWLDQLSLAAGNDPWVLGFQLCLHGNEQPVGQCGFKGPPNSEGEVEIAYFVEPDKRGQGYATEAANALVGFALEDDRVKLILAHTLPEENASTHVLTQCGFTHVGDFTDPEDGLVWQWQFTDSIRREAKTRT